MKPVVHRFHRASDFWWIFKPPSVLDEEIISQFLKTTQTVVLPDNTVAEHPVSLRQLAVREIALLFGGTNIPSISLGKSSTIPQIEAVLYKMPRLLVMELWYALGKAFPDWGPDDSSEYSNQGENLSPGERSVGLTGGRERREKYQLEDDEYMDSYQEDDYEEQEPGISEEDEFEELFFIGFYDFDL